MEIAFSQQAHPNAVILKILIKPAFNSMTMKKRLVFFAVGIASLCVLFAFTLPETAQGNILTLLFPNEVRAIAKQAPVVSNAKTDKMAASDKKTPTVAVLPQYDMAADSNPPLKKRSGDFMNSGTNTIDRDSKAVEQKMEYNAVSNRPARVQQCHGTDINMSAFSEIGEKLNLNFNNTQATFDFDNQMKLNYDTKNFSEDEIIQNVQIDDVSMPLRTNLIKVVQNLFGFKTEMKPDTCVPHYPSVSSGHTSKM
jgi:cell surface protein SprA